MQQSNPSQGQFYMPQQPPMSAPYAQAQMQQMNPMQPQTQGFNNFQQNQVLNNLWSQLEQLADTFQPTRQNQKYHKGAPTVEPKHSLPSVYVGNLPKDFYNLDFLQFFKSRGYKVLYAKVISKEDPATKRQKRFGFLQFTSIEEAQRCQQEMNNTQIQGKTVNMSVVQPGFDDKANVIVRNLAPELSQQKLWDHFKAYGKIKSLKLEEFPDGKSRGFCFIQFHSKEDAERCIKEAHQTELLGKQIEVTNHKNKEERYGDNLYVQNLPQGTTDQSLEQMFAEFGQIQSARIQRNDQGELLRQGFVCFAAGDAAQKALEAMNKKKMEDGSFLIVSQHVYSGNAPEGFQKVLQKTFDSNLFVRNVPSSIPEEEVKKVFEKKGPIVSVHYFVLYADVNDAKKAIQEFDQSNVFGSRLLKVEFWESPEEREEKREQKQWRQMKQFLYPPKSFDDGNMAQGQQRGGYNKGRGGYNKGNPMPRQGQFNNQGPRQQQQQPVMSGNNFPAMGGQPGQPAQQQPQPLTPQQKQQIGDQIYPHIHAKYPEHSAKIVGVLLDTPQVDQMRLIQDQTYLMGVAEQVNVNFQRQMQAAPNTTTQQ